MRVARKVDMLANVAVILASFSLLMTAVLFQQNREFSQVTRNNVCLIKSQRVLALEERRAETFQYLNSPTSRERSPFNTFLREVAAPTQTADVAKARAEWPAACGPLPTATSR